MWQLFNNFNQICDILSFLKIKTGYSESFFPAISVKKEKKEKIQVRVRDDAHCPIYTPSDASSETQGQIVGTRESLNGRKNVPRRKVKNGEKSPWGQCLTRPVPNGRSRSAF